MDLTDPNATVDPVADPVDPAPAADPAAPDPQKDLQAAIDSVVTQLRNGAQAIATAVPPAADPAPKPAPAGEPFTRETLNTIARQQGAGAAFTAYTENVLLPAQMANIATASMLNKKIAERDPEIGPLLKRYDKQINEKIRALGISDAYLAQHGWEGVVRMVASEDPAYINEKAQEIADRKIAEATKPKPAAVPKIEGVSVAPTTVAPGAQPSRDQQIAAVKVTPDEVATAAELYGMTEADLKRQRFEMAEQEKKYGVLGLKQAGGIPICDLSDIMGGRN